MIFWPVRIHSAPQLLRPHVHEFPAAARIRNRVLTYDHRIDGQSISSTCTLHELRRFRITVNRIRPFQLAADPYLMMTILAAQRLSHAG